LYIKPREEFFELRFLARFVGILHGNSGCEAVGLLIARRFALPVLEAIVEDIIKCYSDFLNGSFQYEYDVMNLENSVKDGAMLSETTRLYLYLILFSFYLETGSFDFDMLKPE